MQFVLAVGCMGNAHSLNWGVYSFDESNLEQINIGQGTELRCHMLLCYSIAAVRIFIVPNF